jgi:lipoprotein-anchoring transpeptidase ErfK/SrfK
MRSMIDRSLAELAYAKDRLVIFTTDSNPLARILATILVLAVVVVGYTQLTRSSSPQTGPYAVHTFSVYPTTTTTTAPPPLVTAPTTAPTDPQAQVVVPDQTLVATFTKNTQAYASPSLKDPSGSVPAQWRGAKTVLPVLTQTPEFYQVRLAQRPNGATAWVKATDVTITQTPYFIVVDLYTTKLTLYRSGAQLAQFPAGVGSNTYPTPTGTFFVAFDAAPEGPGYGPFIMATSAHSDVIQDWGGSGDAMIAIHGPLGSDRAIGTTGAHITHGCIRLHLGDQAQLRQVPQGTPVVVVA